MNGLKHNPYIGSFHGGHSLLNDKTANSNTFMIESSKNNPLIGLFRHSPSTAYAKSSLGLKGIIYETSTEVKSTMGIPTLSQLQILRTQQAIPRRNFISSLKKLPTKRYSASAASSASSDNGYPQSVSQLSIGKCHIQTDDSNGSNPICSICLESYQDGDELFTLACDHCFHRNCASQWFFQNELNHHNLQNNHNDASNNFTCPECRQDHIFCEQNNNDHNKNIKNDDNQNDDNIADVKSENDNISNNENNHDFCEESFMNIGMNLVRSERGYDFLSDVASEIESVISFSNGLILPDRISFETISSNISNKFDLSMKPVYSNEYVLDDLSQVTISNNNDNINNNNNNNSNNNNNNSLKSSVVEILFESVYSDCGVPLLPNSLSSHPK
eukprot:gene13590-18240_t